MFGVKMFKGAVVASLFACFGGCAVVPFQPDQSNVTSLAERDVLAEAGAAVSSTPWPAIKTASVIERMTGGGGDSFTQSDAAAHYLVSISHEVSKSDRILLDAERNLYAAAQLQDAAARAVESSRLSKNDVVILEEAIKSLTQNRQVFTAVFRQLEKSGVDVDKASVDQISDQYRQAVRQLGATADNLAERIEQDRTRAFAKPQPSMVNELNSGI